MIRSLCEEFAQQLAEFRQRKDTHDAYRSLGTVLNGMKGLLSRVHALRSVRQGLLEQGIPIDGLQPREEKVLASIGVFRTRLEGTLCELAQGREYRNLRTHLRQYLDTLEAEASSAWKTWHRVQTPQFAPDALQALAVLPQFRASVENAQRLQDCWRQAGDHLPASLAELQENLTILAEFRQALMELPTGWQQPAITTFLQACKTGPAPLWLLTVETLQWLADHELLDAFQIMRASDF